MMHLCMKNDAPEGKWLSPWSSVDWSTACWSST